MNDDKRYDHQATTPLVEPDEAVESTPDAGMPDAATAEIEILRDELLRVQQALEEAERRADEFQNKYLRARADLDNYRRRSAGDLDRAREAGLDSAVLSVLTVFDDLGRALQMADEDDPTKIIPGVRAVKESLLRNLELIGISPVGEIGETFDPGLHEALTSTPTDRPELAGTIAEVFEAGFRRGDRLVRPARVVVYQE